LVDLIERKAKFKDESEDDSSEEESSRAAEDNDVDFVGIQATVKGKPEIKKEESSKNVSPPATTPTTAPNSAPANQPPPSTTQANQKKKQTAFDTIISPVLTSLEKTVAAEQKKSLSNLKDAFEQAEDTIPGITHKILAQVIQLLQQKK